MSVVSVLEHVFPPPRYIHLPNVGVDISDTSLKYVQFERKHVTDTDLWLLHYGDIDIPEGVLERGKVLSEEKLVPALKAAREACKTPYIRVSLPEERAYLFETTVKHDTPFSEIRGLLEFKLEENVPISPRDAFFDYEVVERGEDGGLRVAVTVYGKETILQYYEACTRAGLTPLSFEIEADAIARASIPTGASGTYMLVDFGKTRTGVGIVHDGSLMYTSTIDVGGDRLSKAMRTVMGDVAEDEITKAKNTSGLSTVAENRPLYEVIVPVIDQVKDELETRINYWHTRDTDKKERAIEKVILCGGSVNLKGLPEYLSVSLGLPVERAEVWQNAFSLDTYVPSITRRYSFGYATAIGLALTDFVSS